MDDLKDILSRFLERETLTLTISGALGRNKTYRDNRVTEKQRKEFRDSLRNQLRSKLKEYEKGQVREKDHVANIEDLSSVLSKGYSEILADGQFRIGTAQKALNLYLKYCWARGIIEEPPHCPIDSIVLKKIKSSVAWTQIRELEEYKRLIGKVREEAEAQGKTLARWELDVWQAGL